jgi:hypothetical protein
LAEIAVAITQGSGTNIAGNTDTAGYIRQVVTPGDTGSNTQLMPSGVSLTSSGGNTTTAVAASVATDTVIKATPGRLCKVLVTTTGTVASSFYDNATTHTGTVIGYIPANPTVGTVYDFQFPAANGITYGGNASNPGLTISWV